MKLWFLLIGSLALRAQCKALIWLFERVRSRMAAGHLIRALFEIELMIRNVRMLIENDNG